MTIYFSDLHRNLKTGEWEETKLPLITKKDCDDCCILTGACIGATLVGVPETTTGKLYNVAACTGLGAVAGFTVGCAFAGIGAGPGLAGGAAVGFVYGAVKMVREKIKDGSCTIL